MLLQQLQEIQQYHFFNSKSGSTVLSSTQSLIRFINDGTYNNRQWNYHFSDIIVLNSLETVQLAGFSSATTTGIVFNFVSCNITRMFE